MAADIITVIAQENGGFFRKHGEYLNQYLQIAVSMMMDIDDDENWVNGVFGSEEELDTDTATHVMGCVVEMRWSSDCRWLVVSQTHYMLQPTSLSCS